MTLKELKERVDFALSNGDEERNGELVVCIPNNKHSMGPLAVTKVKSVSKGFDWNNGVFFIWPEKKMTEKL